MRSEAALITTEELEPRPALGRLILPVAFLALLWFVLCKHLSNEWAINEQYSYGWFVPFFAGYLFWLRWESKPEKVGSRKVEVGNSIRAASPQTHFLLLAALLPLRAFEVGNPDWRPLGWIHATIVVGVTLLVIGYWGGKRAVRRFAFPVCFIFIAVPWV
ncbi:MAG: exosortase/archaeosortase family protein, partial [Verrucomicrobiota bacterium]|nr:exosortase/archaeosortase family protein [Verrucomicrobiota bacterium]